MVKLNYKMNLQPGKSQINLSNSISPKSPIKGPHSCGFAAHVLRMGSQALKNPCVERTFHLMQALPYRDPTSQAALSSRAYHLELLNHRKDVERR